jgi:hypothetical protein
MSRPAIFTIITLFLVLFAASASAATMLELKDVRIEVDGDKQSANEGGGSIDITPDSKLTMKVEVENIFDNSVEDAEIEDIEVRATLEDIDDGDDVEIEADRFDLRPGRDKTVTLTFDIPLRLETDETFKLILEVEGEDKNSTIHELDVEYDVDVDKENHEIRFLTKELVPAKVSCTRSTQARVELINTGEDDEDVELTVVSTELGYNKRLEFEMSEDIDDDENEYVFTDTVDLDDAKPGVYTFKIRVEYNDNRDSLDAALPIEIEACAADEPEPEPEPEPKTTTTTTPTTTQPSQPVEVVSAPAQNYVRPSAIVATPRTDYSESWWSKNKWLMVILVTDLVLVIAGIIVIMTVLRRRK